MNGMINYPDLRAIALGVDFIDGIGVEGITRPRNAGGLG
jgi:hypothetical protein